MTALTDRIRLKCIECGDCLIWQGSAVNGKHPQMRIEGHTRSVRRVWWEQENGPVPEGKEIAATCETRNCISHTEPQTRAKIAKRTAATGVFARPARCAKLAAQKQAKSKLTYEQAMDVRFGGGSLREAALRNGITKGAAGFIRRGERWKEYGTHWAGLGKRT